ncbi:MAG: GNAT family N-acetyltransferase [Bacteroidales bacterium]|nr:GNAT family N-acetyltransferase [Bacteroidales bacterium]
MQVISDADKIDRTEWSDFVYKHPHGNIFLTPEMFDVYKNTKNYIPLFLAIIDENKEIQALLLAVIQREYSGIIGNFSARSIVFGGPIIKDNSYEKLDQLLNKYDQIIKRKAIYTQFRNFYCQNGIREIFVRNDYTYVNHLNIILDLSVGEDELWKNFSRSRKKGIKKALSENFIFEFTHDKQHLREFYRLLSNTYRRIKLPIPEEGHFEEILKIFSNNNFQIFSIHKNGEIVVAMFALVYKKTILGYYMGSVSDNEIIKQKPIDLLFWEVFKWSIDRGLNFFDWMGAGKPEKSYGVRDFKLQYGGETKNFGRFEKTHKPLIYNLAKIGLTIWQKL